MWPIFTMMFTADISAMPAWLLSNRRFRLDQYLIATLSNLVYLIVFLTKFRSSLVRRSIKMPCGSAADKEARSDQDRIHHGRGKRCPAPPFHPQIGRAHV